MLKKIVCILLPFIVLSCAATSVKNDNERPPLWMESADAMFNRMFFVTATGSASSREMAEKNALENLASFFGQSIHSERNEVTIYREAVVNGILDSWSDSVELNNVIKTSIVMDNLAAVEIKDVYYDSRRTYHAIAVMEKARAIRIYRELIQANFNIINNLVTMPDNEKNSLSGVMRYRFAAVTADINVSYRDIIILLDGNITETITGGDFYRLQALEIIKTIPIGLRVTNDRNGRIYGAFARCFTNTGFRVVAAQSGLRYVLDVNVNISPVDLPNNPNIMARIEIDAALKDNNLDLLLYNFSSREGHTSRAEAENRCVAAAEQGITREYAVVLSDYLSSLNPRK
ncbi:MAG: LPP20 family lipoprotein [Treponema sp.]|nr:LPP20 family lipoprotein [Treponema sp.]